MRIGELAAQAGTTVQALRYYEREGLLCPPGRNGAGYRTYTPADLEQVRFIKHCQQLGFALKEIQQLAALHGMKAAAPPGCPAALSPREEFLRISRQRLAFLDAKIVACRGLRRQVAALVRQAERQPAQGCPAHPGKK
ncbi:MAG TPA: MerR family transcriptional regulator [Terriglobales bacterium]|nr:MerR family transcriptional regulator [Terriglobales bacterium]